MPSRKSRKAKARKSQSRKNQRGNAMKWLLYGGGVLVFLLIVALVFAYNSVRTYLRSDDFRAMLGTEAGFLLQGEAGFTPFEWDGWSVRTEEFTFEKYDGTQNLHARGINSQVDIGAAWAGIYRIEDVQLRELEFVGDFRADAGLGVPPPEPRPEKVPGFWDRFLPDTLEVTRVNVANVTGRALTDGGAWAWNNVSAEVLPGSTKKVYELELNGGEVNTPLSLIDKLSLRTAKGRFSGDQFFLLSSSFDVLENARLTAVGDFGIESKAWQFQGELTGARIQEIISEDWKQRLMGPLEASFEVTGRPDREPRITGHLNLKDGVLTALPVLDRIAAYTNTIRFRRLALSEASLDFEKVGTRLELNQIILASEGLVRLEGSMRIDGNVIQKGDFRLGITPGTLDRLPGAESKVFERGELGLLWTPLKVSGTLDAPQEDLSERLIAAAGERMFELLPESGQFALKYSGKVIGESTQKILADQGVILGVGKAAINRASDLLKEGIGGDPGGVIEGGADAVKGGVDTLFDLFGRPVEK